VFENRGFNSYHASLSAQPMFGGPVYFIRNICYNTPGTALKYMIRPAGIYTYNNTFITEAAISVFSNGHFRNNIFMGPSDSRPALSATNLTTYSTMDFNGYRKKSNSEKPYRLRYPTSNAQNQADEKELTWVEASSLKELGKLTGFELHSTELDFDVFENVPIPDKRGHIYAVEGINFSLRKGSKATDAGVAIPNITDGFVGKAPDLGALEDGAAMPVYGPRN
jgi:hypothetical protein